MGSSEGPRHWPSLAVSAAPSPCRLACTVHALPAFKSKSSLPSRAGSAAGDRSSSAPPLALCSPLCPHRQAGIDYEYEGLEAAVPRKAKKTKFDD